MSNTASTRSAPDAKRICLVGSGHLASNPRLVKEAEALSTAGFRVRVVAADYMDAIRRLDDTVTAGVAWDVSKVSAGPALARRLRGLRRRMCSWLTARGFVPHVWISLWAENDLVGKLARAAAAEPADLYIAHSLPGLAAAGYAAKVHGAALGFDAEDSHVDELPDVPACRGRRQARERIERSYLPRCRHLTAASPGIAAALRRRYQVEPVTILNVFPLSEAPPAPVTPESLSKGGRPTLYWFSQTIGPGRGLEPLLDALSLMRIPVDLHLRGILATGYAATLKGRAGQRGFSGVLHFHDQASPNQMAVLAAGHDLGLALELCEPPNRGICLTNKIFTYLLAGIPVLLSRTPAQEEIAAELGDAALLVDLDDPAGMATRLDAYFGNPSQQGEARRQAWALGQARYNWDFEQTHFLLSVRRALGLEAVCASS